MRCQDLIERVPARSWLFRKRGIVKTVIALLALNLLFAPGGYTQKVTPPSDAGSEVLIRHLLRRISDLDSVIAKNETKCLEEQISLTNGGHVPHKHDLLEGIDRIVQFMLDSEAAIEEHNRQHPESPWADSKEDIREFCGKCLPQRAVRDLQLKEEAKR